MERLPKKCEFKTTVLLNCSDYNQTSYICIINHLHPFAPLLVQRLIFPRNFGEMMRLFCPSTYFSVILVDEFQSEVGKIQSIFTNEPTQRVFDNTSVESKLGSEPTEFGHNFYNLFFFELK